MNEKELIAKCESCTLDLDNDLMQNCKLLLNSVKENKKELDINDEEKEVYLDMVENLESKDLSKVLQLAMKINSNPDVKDAELKKEASRLIRAIQMS
jgi:hypothetical protein